MGTLRFSQSPFPSVSLVVCLYRPWNPACFNSKQFFSTSASSPPSARFSARFKGGKSMSSRLHNPSPSITFPELAFQLPGHSRWGSGSPLWVSSIFFKGAPLKDYAQISHVSLHWVYLGVLVALVSPGDERFWTWPKNQNFGSLLLDIISVNYREKPQQANQP